MVDIVVLNNRQRRLPAVEKLLIVFRYYLICRSDRMPMRRLAQLKQNGQPAVEKIRIVSRYYGIVRDEVG